MDLLNRNGLRNLFKQGMMPQSTSFSALIDSTVNKIDDGISKSIENGLMLAPEGESRTVISIFQSIQDTEPKWKIDLNADETNFGLCFAEPGAPDAVRLFLQKGGNIGIGTIKPEYKLEINGLAGIKGRTGTFAKGKIAADGKWHDVLTGLNGCNGFELMARVGDKGKGRYAMMHAIALSTFGRSHNKIKKTQAYYGWFWNKMCIRWAGTTYDYKLQMRTRRNYGEGIQIAYNISSIWRDEEMGFPV